MRITRSRVRRRNKKKSMSPKINIKNLSIRKLKQQLRRVASNSFERKKIDNKSLSITDDCVLIETPREVIVIDDDTEAVFDNAENTSLDEPMTAMEDEKIPIIVSKNQKATNNCDESTINNATENTNKIFLNDFVTIDYITNTSNDSTLETLNDENLSDSNLKTIYDSNLETLSETLILTNISAKMSPKSNEIENNYLKIISDDINLEPDSNNSDSVIEVLTNSEYDNINSEFCSGDSKFIKTPLYEISKFNSKVLGAGSTNSFNNERNVYNEKNLRNIEVVITEEMTNKTVKEKSVPIDKIQLSNLRQKNQNRTLGTNENNNLNNSINANRNKPSVPMPISVPNRTSPKIDNEIIQINIDSDDELSIENDESVIFVSEVASSSKALDFIPLSSGNESQSPKKKRKSRSKNSPQLLLNPFKRFKIDLEKKKLITMSTPKNRKPTGEIEFTHSEKKKNEKYNSNTYNPNKDENIKKCEKRMIILDGSNIAFGHGNSNYFSSKGLEIAINFFVTKGHEVKAVVPQFRVNYNRSSDGEKLKELHRLGKIVFTPGKNLPDLRASSYDDRFILQLALEFDAAIVSNDNYRDLINENPGFKKLIENRVVTYTWCNDLFIVAKDPYGKRGPSLDLILNRNVEEQSTENKNVPKQNSEKQQ